MKYSRHSPMFHDAILRRWSEITGQKIGDIGRQGHNMRVQYDKVFGAKITVETRGVKNGMPPAHFPFHPTNSSFFSSKRQSRRDAFKMARANLKMRTG